MQKRIDWSGYYIRRCMHEQSKRYGDGAYCVYLWQENETGTIFYIGSGKFYRFNCINPKARSAEFMEHINNRQCSPKILAYGMTKEESAEFEMQAISEYWKLGFPLVNKQGIAEREREYRQAAERTKRIRGIRPYMHRVKSVE